VSLPIASRWRGLTCHPLIPQDKEGFDSVTSHEENVIFIFEESRTFRSNQLVNEAFKKTIQEQRSIRTEPRRKRESCLKQVFNRPV
jgi:hypothetical protein